MLISACNHLGDFLGVEGRSREFDEARFSFFSRSERLTPCIPKQPDRQEGEMLKSAIQFVAEAIVAHLESGAFPDEGDAARLLYAAEIEIMRELVGRRPGLVERLLKIAEAGTGARPAFALTLIRHWCDQPEVAARLRALFEAREARDPALACHIVWRVLDDPKLPEEWHRRLFDYLMKNWDAWKRHVAEVKEPGPEGMIETVRGRLENPTYPRSKKWIYLLCLPDGLASDRLEAERMIREAASSPEEHMRSVAEVLLSRFYK
jgi:hypothetical protein